ncbi:MAG: hypothetical protein ACI8RZ_007251, partial [Myxococcota bacterium]
MLVESCPSSHIQVRKNELPRCDHAEVEVRFVEGTMTVLLLALGAASAGVEPMLET